MIARTLHPVLLERAGAGNEIDVLIDHGAEQVPVEVKSGETVSGDFFRALRLWRKLVTDDEAPAALVYGGDRSFTREGVVVLGWEDL